MKTCIPDVLNDQNENYANKLCFRSVGLIISQPYWMNYYSVVFRSSSSMSWKVQSKKCCAFVQVPLFYLVKYHNLQLVSFGISSLCQLIVAFVCISLFTNSRQAHIRHAKVVTTSPFYIWFLVNLLLWLKISTM